MHVCLCWLSRHSQSQIRAGRVQLQQTQLHLYAGCWSHGWMQTQLLAAVRSMRCRFLTHARLAPSFSCAAGLRLSGACPLQVEGLKKRVSVAAIRALAILGQNDEVWRAVGRPGHSGRGVRILAMDGGGMKVRRRSLQCWAMSAPDR